MRVAVIGKMHSGKTTFAQELEHHYGFHRIAFADPVKDVAAKMLETFVYETSPSRGQPDGLRRSYSRADVNEMKGHPAIRGLLQLVGTELGRNWLEQENIWVDMFQSSVEDLAYYAEGEHNAEANVVNDDCRFPNEVTRLTEMGFTVIRLVRPEGERIASIRGAIKKSNPDFSEEEVNAALEKMLNHGSEVLIDTLEADVMLPSQNVAQLKRYAKEISTHGTKVFSGYYRSYSPFSQESIEDYLRYT